MGNRIHPTAIVGPCRIGDGNWIGPHVTAAPRPSTGTGRTRPAGTASRPARVTALNEVGLRRLGCAEPMIEAIRSVTAGRPPLSDVELPGDVAGLLRLWRQHD
jgi:hypothetical protein